MATFNFIDSVSDIKKNESLTAFFTLKGNEEFLADHFAGFPVMPGVLLLESLKQAAGLLWNESGPGGGFVRLSRVEEIKFGKFVKPGQRIRLFVRVLQELSAPGPDKDFEGRIDHVEGEQPSGRALWARFSLQRV